MLTLPNENFTSVCTTTAVIERAFGPVGAVSPASNPVLTSGSDLFPVVPNSTLPSFVNSQLVASCHLGFLIMFLLHFFHIVKSGVPVN